jgi:hypothetical protein
MAGAAQQQFLSTPTAAGAGYALRRVPTRAEAKLSDSFRAGRSQSAAIFSTKPLVRWPLGIHGLRGFASEAWTTRGVGNTRSGRPDTNFRDRANELPTVRGFS